MNLPAGFKETVSRVFGDSGRAWVLLLPEIVARCHARWGLPEGVPCAAMRMNYIEFTTTPEGDPVALKIGVPHAELFTEMEALQLYGGRAAARLFDADRELGALLLQRLMPGTMLWQHGDNREQTRIAASVMRRLPVPVPTQYALPTFAQWIERAFHLTRTEWDPQERMPRDLLDRAEEAFREIERDSPDDVVLHGDLHHENILLDERAGWAAIDPKGVIGPRCLEVGRFLQNQLPDDRPIEHRAAIVQERIAIFSAELGFPPKILLASGLVDCILSHCWSFEDDAITDDWYQGIELAHTMCRMLETGDGNQGPYL